MWSPPKPSPAAASFHGLAELTARNHAINAADWQQKANGLPAPQTSLFYPEFQLGGPRDPGGRCLSSRTSCSSLPATEISQQHVDLIPRKSVVPAEAGSPGYTGAGMAKGDFTDSAYLGSLSNAGNNWMSWMVASQPCSGSYWSTACTTLVGYGSNWGQIGSSSIDPARRQMLLGASPPPMSIPACTAATTSSPISPSSEPRNQEIAKIDFAISDNEHLSLRFNHENESVPSPYGPWNSGTRFRIPPPRRRRKPPIPSISI